ncbi:hypothetical protein HYU11_00510 [Candidatus Woesearchaeota archaeon]|nr:hypothetical protein [Candidatus Woesearchaeota archaeon]
MDARKALTTTATILGTAGVIYASLAFFKPPVDYIAQQLDRGKQTRIEIDHARSELLEYYTGKSISIAAIEKARGNIYKALTKMPDTGRDGLENMLYMADSKLAEHETNESFTPLDTLNMLQMANYRLQDSESNLTKQAYELVLLNVLATGVSTLTLLELRGIKPI